MTTTNSVKPLSSAPAIRSGLEIATFILGILSFVLGWFTIVLGVVVAVAGITLGILDLTTFASKSSAASKHVLTWIGLGLCSLTALLCMIAYSANG